MKTALRWIAYIFAGLLILVLAISAIVMWRFNASLPQTEGEITVAGLQNETIIVRDQYGIPHIFAETRHDIFFAVGVVHAQDRLFQLDLSRRAAYGTLSELMGKLTVRTDVQSRVLGLGNAADQSFDNLSPEAKAAFRAYANGVNSVLSAPGFVPPPEYTLLMAKPQPWRPQDSVAVLKVMAATLSGDAFDEPGRAKLLEILGSKKLAEFLAPYPADGPITLSEADLGLDTTRIRENTETFSSASGEPQEGSNNWVVGGQLTSTGKPLLASDPHLGLSAPGVWYFARLQHGDEMTLGATIPGTPFVTLGRTTDAAWGFTNTGPDTADLFVYSAEDIHAQAEEVVIKVRWGADQPITIKRTSQGPILDPAWFNAGKIAKSGEVVVWQSVLDDGDDTTGQIGVTFLTVKTFADFQNSLRDYIMPQQNMVFADSRGTIGFFAPARVPVRDENGIWVGTIPYDELPVSSNSERHYYASANNKIVPDSYPHYITDSWYGLHRIRRIVEMIEDTELHDKRSFSRMQMDTVSDLARRVIPFVAASEPATDGGKELRQILQAWDGNLAADRPEGLIYSTWMRHFTTQLYQDELGDDFEQFWAARREFVDGVLRGEYASWCNDIRTSNVETCHQIAGNALDSTYLEITKKYREPIADLKWGSIHQAKFSHPLLSNTPLGRFFNVRVPVGGDASTVNVAHSSYRSGNFDVLWGASMRAIYDFSDLNSSLFMHGPGQSGNVMSPHYRDLAAAWGAGEFFEIRADWTPQSPPPNSVTLVLQPKTVENR